MDALTMDAFQDNSDATVSNTKANDSAELGKHNYDGSDFSADSGDEYHPPRRNRTPSTSSSIVSSNVKRGKKRLRCPNKWKQNVRKTLKNSGKEYSSKKGTQIKQ
ncbi:unnamed protein product [Colias eurytheme]|nr:unnamed protein product [Colias eurytheme]